MLQKFKQILSKDVTKVFSLNALSTLLRMLTGFISVKIVAVIIGPSGVALLGQLNNFSTIFLTASTGGINSGVTKYIAENAGLQNRINPFLRTALWITTLLSLLCALILIFGSNYFSILILKDNKYQSIIIIFGITIILYSLNSLLISILNGYKQFKKFVRVNTAGSVVGLMFSISLSYLWGVYGALLATVTFQSVVFIITIIQCSKCDWFKKENFIGRYNNIIVKKLAHYSLMALVSAATVPVSQLFVRSYLVKKTSLDDAGVWEGMNRISLMYLTVITTSLGVYYLPRLAEIKTETEMRSEIRSALKLILPSLLLVTVSIFLFRHIIIGILFNNKFSSMEELFAFQLIGDFFKVAAYLLSYQMLAKSMTILYVITEVIFSASFVYLSMYFVNIYGTQGCCIAFAVNYIAYFAFMIIYFNKLIFNRR